MDGGALPGSDSFLQRRHSSVGEVVIKPVHYEKILRQALKGGGEFADIFFEQTHSTLIVCEEDRIEKVISGWDIGAGLRVHIGGRTIYSFTNQMTEKDLLRMAGIVSRAAGEDRGERPIDLTHPRPTAPVHTESAQGIEKDPRHISIQEKAAKVRHANHSARGMDPKVRQVKVLYRDMRQQLRIVNSEGAVVEGERGGVIFSVQVVSTKDDLTQTGYEAVGGTLGFEIFDLNPPEEVAATAARRALVMLSARMAPKGTMAVVLSSRAGGTMIHEAVGHGLEADLAQQGLSVYSKKIGQEVASSQITVLDDPTLSRKRGSFAFDDEGVPARRTTLVEKGVLKTYLYDRLTAWKDGVESNGHGRRESYQDKPIPRMSNTLIAPGTMKPEEIIRSVNRGLFITKMGGGQVNTVNGDFVFEVSEGQLIENGTLGEPVRGAVLLGNGPRVLKEIDMVADDLGFGIGTCGKDGQGVPVADAQPTLRIPEIVVGGQEKRV